MNKYFLVAVLILITGSCTKPNNGNAVYDSNLDERPGYKSIKLRKTVSELQPLIQEVSDNSDLILNDSSAIDEKFAKKIEFETDKLKKVGEFEIESISGTSYRDTLYQFTLHLEGFENLKGFKQILTKIYGKGKEIEDSYFQEEIGWIDRKTKLTYARKKDWGLISFKDRLFLIRQQKTKKVKIDKETVDEF